MFKVMLLLLSCISCITISAALTCNDFNVQSGVDISRAIGKWNVIRLGTIHGFPDYIKPLNDSTDNCLKIHFMDHFAIEDHHDRFITYTDWPAVEHFVPPLGRVNGIEIPDTSNAGRMLFTFPFFTGVDHAEVLVLHTDYKTALILTCLMYEDGTSFSGQIGMVSLEGEMSDDVKQQYLDIIDPYQMEIDWIDFNHENCRN